MTKPADDAKNRVSMSDPEVRKRFKSAIATSTHYLRQMDDIRDGLKDAIADIASEYGVDKKIVRKMARTMYKADYSDLLEETRQFEEMYELVVEGQLRTADGQLQSTPEPVQPVATNP